MEINHVKRAEIVPCGALKKFDEQTERTIYDLLCLVCCAALFENDPKIGWLDGYSLRLMCLDHKMSFIVFYQIIMIIIKYITSK